MLDPLVVLEALAAPDIKITVVGHRFSRKKEREREREREPVLPTFICIKQVH
jgi:hypothetical protein